MIFENKSLEYLINTGEHCIRKDYAEYLKKDTLKEIKHIKGNKNYKIGIIIPNCNYSEWIDKCLTSILNQTYKNYEVIFVDDVSTDDSVKIAKKYKSKMNIKIIELKQKRFNGGARNEGYLYLSDDVDYVYYIDSDDWLINEEVLEKMNNNLQGNPDVLFVGLGADYSGIIRSYYVPKYKDRYEAIKGWSGSSGKLIKKEIALRPENLYQEGTLKEDRTQHYKICIAMDSYRCLDEICYVWNKNNTKSVTTIRDGKWKADTIRNYADSVELYEREKGKDHNIDQILLARVENCWKEINNKGDSQQ